MLVHGVVNAMTWYMLYDVTRMTLRGNTQGDRRHYDTTREFRDVVFEDVVFDNNSYDAPY